MRHGFDAVYMTGAGTSAARLGMPDVGLLTMTEMVDNAARIAAVSELPLIADADNGYGGPLNVRRTIQEYERAGVAAVHLEDQVLPKRCGHLAGKQLIPVADMVAQDPRRDRCPPRRRLRADRADRRDRGRGLRAGARARRSVSRGRRRRAVRRSAGTGPAGCDQPQAAVAAALYNMATSGKTPFLTRREIAALGFKLIIYPNWMMLAAIKAASAVLQTLRDDETIAAIAPDVPNFQQFFDLVGMQEVRALEERYGVPDASRAGY